MKYPEARAGKVPRRKRGIMNERKPPAPEQVAKALPTLPDDEKLRLDTIVAMISALYLNVTQQVIADMNRKS